MSDMTDKYANIQKALAFAFFFIWMRGTLPRLRYDQLMQLGWKVLTPLALLNILVTAWWLMLFTSR